MPPPTQANGIFQFLRTATDEINANKDYSGAPETFFIEAQSGGGSKDQAIARMIVSIEFYGRPVQPEGYGSIARALKEGIKVRITSNGGLDLEQDLLDTLVIRRHMDWARYCYDVPPNGSAVQAIHARWTFRNSRAFQPSDGAPTTPIVLAKNSGFRFEVVVNDNLKDLKGHFFQVQGEVL